MSAISDSLLEGRQAGTVVGQRYLLSAKWRRRYAVILIYFGSTFFYGVIFKRYATRPHGAHIALASDIARVIFERLASLLTSSKWPTQQTMGRCRQYFDAVNKKKKAIEDAEN